MTLTFGPTNEMILDAEFASQLDSMPMCGTERQVTWAKDIRHKAIKGNVLRFNGMVGGMRLRQQEITAELREACAAGISKLASIDDAKFWIDNRDASPQLLMSKYGR